jgi:hypothetical protein
MHQLRRGARIPIFITVSISGSGHIYCQDITNIALVALSLPHIISTLQRVPHTLYLEELGGLHVVCLRVRRGCGPGLVEQDVPRLARLAAFPLEGHPKERLYVFLVDQLFAKKIVTYQIELITDQLISTQCRYRDSLGTARSGIAHAEKSGSAFWYILYGKLKGDCSHIFARAVLRYIFLWYTYQQCKGSSGSGCAGCKPMRQTKAIRMPRNDDSHAT